MADPPDLLLVNQTVGPLFADVVAAAARRGAVTLMAGGALPSSLPPLRLRRGPAYRRTSAPLRLISWGGFSLWLAWRLWRDGRRRHATAAGPLLVVSNPPLAPLLAPLARRPYSLLLYDLYPQVLAGLGPGPRLALAPVIAVWHWLNRRVVRGAERVITLSAPMAEALRPCFATEAAWARSVRVVPPWGAPLPPAPSPAVADFRRRHGVEGALLLVYAGNLGFSHPLEPLLEALPLLPPPGARLLLVGQGGRRPQLQHRVRRRGMQQQVVFLDPLPPEGLAVALAAADLAVVALAGGLAAASLPSKAFTALAAGCPLLAIAPPRSALADLVQHHGCGLLLPPGPGAARPTAAALAALAADPGHRRRLARGARQAALQHTSARAEDLIHLWLS
jgi:colanic acid biosynthesis glycosyl transferase WcaI